MNLKDEVINLLQELKNSDLYYNPHALWSIIEAVRDTEGDDAIPEDILDWADEMWSW